MKEEKAPELELDMDIDRLIHEPARLKIMAFLSIL